MKDLILHTNYIILNLTYLTFIACIFIFIIPHGLIPFNEDGDTWGHYMQYFESIKYTSSIHANEFWYHFHLSKGAGLFYFFNSVSDILSVQIISTLCIILIAIIIIVVEAQKNVMRSTI